MRRYLPTLLSIAHYVRYALHTEHAANTFCSDWSHDRTKYVEEVAKDKTVENR